MKAVLELLRMGFQLEIVNHPEIGIKYTGPANLQEPEEAKQHLERLKKNKREAVAFSQANYAAEQFAQI